MADVPADKNQDEWNEETVYGPSTVIAALDQIEDLVESSRSVPLSASIMINKAEILDLLDQAREALPEDLVAADAVEPPLVPAVLSGGIVPPPFGLLDEHPTRTNEPASTPAPSAPTTRRRPDRHNRERAITTPPQSRRAQPLGTPGTPPTLPTGSQQNHGPNEPHPSFCRSPHSRE